jgi:DNA-binding transcriptional regulator YhcF (GntR family)
MLEKIFGSKARVKILKAFLMKPDEKFYIRQLARDLKLQVNSVRRELINLEDFGLLYSDTNTKSASLSSDKLNLDKNDNKGELENSKDEVSQEKEVKTRSIREKKYYQLNKNFILFSEIKSLIVKSQILSGESFIKKLKMICDPKFILLGGMFLNNENAPTDVLIVADVEKEKLMKIIQDLEFELNREVNFTAMDEKEFRYRQEVADVFLHGVLNSKKIVLLDKILDVKK